jgi:2,4-dienoyl-CoA reductase-like NADH-dependent reductase (Old Yellow Enzyme family)
MSPMPGMPLLFQPLSIRDLTLKNRVVIAPMMQHAAPNGLATPWHLVHLGKFALGGAGLILTESTAVSPVGRIGKDDLGLWNDDHVDALLPIVDFVHANGAAIGVQLGHAGRKAGSMPLWDGGGMPLDPESMTKVDPNWHRIGPSAIAAALGWSVPDAMDETDINLVVEEFRAAAFRADRAGFDVVELHFGHGYLVASFLSPVSNKRQDAYGGNRTNRMRLALKIVSAVREVWPSSKPLFCRVSSVDGALGGWSIEDTVALAIEFKRIGVDVVDCSSGGLSDQGAALPVARGLGFQVPFAHQVRQESGVLTQAVGMIVNAQQAEDILCEGSADLIAVGREVLYDPYWALHAQADLCPDANFGDWPLPHGVWLAKRHPTLQEALTQGEKSQMNGLKSIS